MTDPIDFERLYRDALPSVVSIYTPTGTKSPRGAGSGFVYRDDHILTNHHVTTAAPQGEDIEIRFADGTWRLGTLIGSDPYTDLAVLHIPDRPPSADPLPMAPTNPTPGRPVAALGNPLGLDGSITTGIVSGINRSMPTGQGFAIPDVVQTDAPINPGNSGGPLVGLAPDHEPGLEVVGVNRAKTGDNIGFAVSPAIVNRVGPVLITDGDYPHPYLRIRTLDITPVIAEANGLDDPNGILVVDTHPSHRHLLQGCHRTHNRNRRVIPTGGDVILGIDDQPLDSHEDLMRYLITQREPGDIVRLDILRDGHNRTVEVPLVERPRLEADPGTDIPIR